MKLEVGMYVRTKCGIEQIYRIDNNKTKWKYVYKLKEQDGDGCINIGILSSEDILKASHNIIDLLQVGDIITFKEDEDVYKILQIPSKEWDFEDFYLVKNYDGETEDIFVEYEEMKKYINSIVTKELFEKMTYKVV